MNAPLSQKPVTVDTDDVDSDDTGVVVSGDSEAPEIEFVRKPRKVTSLSKDQRYYSNAYDHFNFVVTDEGAGEPTVVCKLNNLVVPCESGENLSLEGLIEGEHKFTVEAEDSAGNRKEASYSFVVDRTAPQLKIISSPGSVTDLQSSGVSVCIYDSSKEPLDCNGGITGTLTHKDGTKSRLMLPAIYRSKNCTGGDVFSRSFNIEDYRNLKSADLNFSLTVRDSAGNERHISHKWKAQGPFRNGAQSLESCDDVYVPPVPSPLSP